MDSNWCVKYGVWEKLTDAAISEEYEAIKSNRFASDLKPAFDIAGIDFGRADHAKVGGRTIVYEINTNPFIGPYVPDPRPLRRESQALARQRFAIALAAIDTPDCRYRVGAGNLSLLRLQRRGAGDSGGSVRRRP